MLYYFLNNHAYPVSQVWQRSAVVLAPVNNYIIVNDVAPSHRRR